MADIVAFTPDDDLKVNIMDSDDGPLVIIGVENEKALVLPLTLFVHLIQAVDDECNMINIHTEEAASATKH